MATKHLTQSEVARRWCLSPRTLERWRWLGKGPPFLKIGGRVAYRLEDIEKFEAAQIRTISGRTGDRRPAA
jgi:predicted site-specific integrase-resolvase